MTNLVTKEDKLRLLARLFYQDNQDQYEDYHEALAEFMNTENTSDAFVSFATDQYFKPEPGHFTVINKDGHVAHIRNEDGFFNPVTVMTEEDGEEIEEAFQTAVDKYPDLEGRELLEKIGWKVIASNITEG